MQQGFSAGEAKQWAAELVENPDSFVSPGVSNQDVVMLRYALKLTREPANMNESDVQALRDVGFDDCAIHDICNVTAYFAFVNRVADGLGVELEN